MQVGFLKSEQKRISSHLRIFSHGPVEPRLNKAHTERRLSRAATALAVFIIIIIISIIFIIIIRTGYCY